MKKSQGHGMKPNWAQKGGTKRYWNKVQSKLKKESKKDERSDNRFTEI